MSKKYKIVMDTTLDELIELKRRGARIRKLTWGLTVKEYGHIYSADGYRMRLKEDPDEIRRRLKEVK